MRHAENKKIFITGVAGFIGFHVAERLLSEGYIVVGCDNMNNYYDVSLKEYRLSLLEENKNFIFYQYDILDTKKINSIFHQHVFVAVVHLASMVGVRHSHLFKDLHYQSNIIGFRTVIRCATENNISLFIYASSSSVYGDSDKIPFSEKNILGSSLSYYADTKRENERTAEEFSRTTQMRCIGLRFFTVYGPMMRPDMALFIFIKKILNNEPIILFGDGLLRRDFTCVHDIVDMIIKSLESKSVSGVFNVGTGSATSLYEIIQLLEKNIGMRALCVFDKKPDADMQITCADTQMASEVFGYTPKISLEKGVKELIEWYRFYYEK